MGKPNDQTPEENQIVTVTLIISRGAWVAEKLRAERDSRTDPLAREALVAMCDSVVVSASTNAVMFHIARLMQEYNPNEIAEGLREYMAAYSRLAAKEREGQTNG